MEPIKLVEVSIKLKKIMDWLICNQPLILATDATKIVINIKGQNVAGEITCYPDRKQT